jgi:hypothetical protein
VYVVVQLAVVPLTLDSVHGVGLNESPETGDEKPTLPVGVLGEPASVSVTVAVHVVPTATSTVGEQEIAVLVVRASTVSVVEPLPVPWVASPP